MSCSDWCIAMQSSAANTSLGLLLWPRWSQREWTGRHHISSTAWQGRGTLGIFWRWTGPSTDRTEGPADREVEPEDAEPTSHPSRPGKICVQPDQHWLCFKAILGRLPRDGGKRVWTFPSAAMPSASAPKLKTDMCAVSSVRVCCPRVCVCVCVCVGAHATVSMCVRVALLEQRHDGATVVIAKPKRSNDSIVATSGGKIRPWNWIAGNSIGATVPAKFEAVDFVGFCNGACTIRRSFNAKSSDSAAWCTTVQKRMGNNEKETLNEIIKLLSNAFPYVAEYSRISVCVELHSDHNVRTLPFKCFTIYLVFMPAILLFNFFFF